MVNGTTCSHAFILRRLVAFVFGVVGPGEYFLNEVSL